MELRTTDSLIDDLEERTALVLAAHEILAWLGTPALFSQLCRVSTEALGCNFGHLWLWNRSAQAITAVAGHGDSVQHWESLRLLRLPRKVIESTQLREVSQAASGEAPHWALAVIATHYGMTRTLYIPLWSNNEVTGMLCVGHRGRVEPFTERQMRIARAIEQMASVAIHHNRQLAELEEGNRIKANFIATMSHEMRRSLGNIVGFADLLAVGEFGALPSEAADAMRILTANAWESLDVIKATLDLSRDEIKNNGPDKREVAVGDLINEMAQEVEARNVNPAVQLSWVVPLDAPVLHTDPVKLKMALNNLIDNALKFTPEGNVTIAVDPQEHGVEFAVTDTGPGVPPQERVRIFEAFEQLDACEKVQGGIGLGLYITRRLVDILGGRITLESEVGRGSTFRIWLPVETIREAA